MPNYTKDSITNYGIPFSYSINLMWKTRKTGRAEPCINAQLDDEDFGTHIMRTVYVRASLLEEGMTPKSRKMLALGYFCFKCRQFWTNEDVNKIIEELQELRDKQIDEYVRRHNNTEIVN